MRNLNYSVGCNVRLLAIAFVIIFLSCKKNAPEDIHIRGNVRNNCTGLPFPDRLVQLSFENQLFDRTTDANGDFDFGIVTVRPKDKTKFKLGVPGFSNQDFELYGLTVLLDAEEIAQNNQFGISASFKVMILHYPVVNNPDTLYITATQKTLSNFEPQRITELKLKDFDIKTQYDFGINGYPMGWWHFEIKKYKAGNYSTVYDSIFMGMGETKTYNIPW